jgi:hypothetical protein
MSTNPQYLPDDPFGVFDHIKQIRYKVNDPLLQKTAGTPLLVDRVVKALMEKGISKERAFAIAVGSLQRKGFLKPGTMELTEKGEQQTAKHRAKGETKESTSRQIKRIEKEAQGYGYPYYMPPPPYGYYYQPPPQGGFLQGVTNLMGTAMKMTPWVVGAYTGYKGLKKLYGGLGKAIGRDPLEALIEKATPWLKSKLPGGTPNP